MAAATARWRGCRRGDGQARAFANAAAWVREAIGVYAVKHVAARNGGRRLGRCWALGALWALAVGVAIPVIVLLHHGRGAGRFKAAIGFWAHAVQLHLPAGGF